jgi:hypothetical protein
MKCARERKRFSINRGSLVKFAAEDLLALERALRKLQEPHGRVFWRLEQLIGRIGDELCRRASS